MHQPPARVCTNAFVPKGKCPVRSAELDPILHVLTGIIQSGGSWLDKKQSPVKANDSSETPTQTTPLPHCCNWLANTLGARSSSLDATRLCGCCWWRSFVFAVSN